MNSWLLRARTKCGLEKVRLQPSTPTYMLAYYTLAMEGNNRTEAGKQEVCEKSMASTEMLKAFSFEQRCGSDLKPSTSCCSL